MYSFYFSCARTSRKFLKNFLYYLNFESDTVNRNRVPFYAPSRTYLDLTGSQNTEKYFSRS